MVDIINIIIINYTRQKLEFPYEGLQRIIEGQSIVSLFHTNPLAILHKDILNFV